ncbi:hypothetical protein PUN28_002244 [Cardiocondyla obscurior]|uniref:Uncharacterized protein n=1 Tax=Cardiocondyla obscurior TaxID=286306 RepID=A0AAW2GT62_9HYME
MLYMIKIYKIYNPYYKYTINQIFNYTENIIDTRNTTDGKPVLRVSSSLLGIGTTCSTSNLSFS